MPAVVDYHPYRASDFTAPRDSATYSRLASYGFACLKVDVRGTGNSDGIHVDQFAEAYLDDVVLMLDWIARQPWCDGTIGMTGVSWGAHAALMTATRRPPALKAIIPVTAADDRYLNRYQGGCLLLYTVWWGAIYGAMQSRPPLPAIVGDAWRERWRERLEQTRNYLQSWLAHPSPDSYWQAGSASADFSRIACPVFSVAGWSDPGYAVTMPRLMEGLAVPRQALIGPWGHRAPQVAMPGPAIDFLALAARWFGRWLGAGDDAATHDTALALWMLEGVPPDATRRERPGRWIVEPDWPPPGIEHRRLYFGPGTLSAAAGGEALLAIRSPLTLGLAAAGEWMPWFPAGSGPDLPADQRFDDAASLVFDSPPLDGATEILGAPRLSLSVAADQPHAQIVVRLCDVAPDGSSARVTYGFLNLSCRDGEERPAPLEPGKQYAIELPLYPIAYRFPAGHRIRIAISTSYWPIIWPARAAASLTLAARGCILDLPARSPRPEGEHPDPPGPPPPPAGMPITVLSPPRACRRFEQDLAAGLATLTVEEDGGHQRLEESGIELWSKTLRAFAIHPDDPLSAAARITARWGLRQGGWQVETEMRSVVTADDNAFRVRNELDAFEGGVRAYSRSWDFAVPRGPL